MTAQYHSTGNVNEAFSNVQATYQRRADLIPNLVATVKEAAENERGILTAVTQARAGIGGRSKDTRGFGDCRKKNKYRQST
ncbi:MAG: LemA family protein [Cytophagales bacterium]|nr:LemA family protein [Cytophagales bacterium]